MADCSEKYAGPSFPVFHGLKCIRVAPHRGMRHVATPNGRPLQWWTPEEKQTLRRAREAILGNDS